MIHENKQDYDWPSRGRTKEGFAKPLASLNSHGRAKAGPQVDMVEPMAGQNSHYLVKVRFWLHRNSLTSYFNLLAYSGRS